LENQEGYKICKDLNKKIVVLQENLNEFAVITQKKLEKLEKSETTDFKKNYVEKITELDDKTAVIKNSINKKIYFILLGLLAVSAVTLVIVVALI
jgi:phosphorylcholine metabolism protein LicD